MAGINWRDFSWCFGGKIERGWWPFGHSPFIDSVVASCNVQLFEFLLSRNSRSSASMTTPVIVLPVALPQASARSANWQGIFQVSSLVGSERSSSAISLGFCWLSFVSKVTAGLIRFQASVF